MILSKIDLRKQLLTKRLSLSAGEVDQRSNRVFQTLTSHFKDMIPATSKSVAFYYPIKGEVDSRPFFKLCKSKNLVCLFPRIEKDQLAFFRVDDFSELQIGPYGIAEPNPRLGQNAVLPDVLFVPGVAFSKTCFRIGFGAGYYDRFIEACVQNGTRPTMRFLGLAYDFQIFENLPIENHDHPMDVVVSENVFFEDMKK